VVEVKVRHEINGTIGMKDETTVHSDDDDMYVSPIIPILYARQISPLNSTLHIRSGENFSQR